MLKKDPVDEPIQLAPLVVFLGSGSAGNSLFIEFGGTCLLVDTGFSAAETTRRLRAIGVEPSDLDAMLITHEHVDHVRGIAVLSKKNRIPVYIAPSTYSAFKKSGKSVHDRVEFFPGQSFHIGKIEVLPFPVPHDAADPVGFRLIAGSYVIGVATDLGHAPLEVTEYLKGSDILVLESNHDIDMLKNGPYPWYLKQRILGRSGHLSNDAMNRMLEEVVTDRCRLVALAHISKVNNSPEVAKMSCEIALNRLGLEKVKVKSAGQDRPTGIWGREV